MLNWLSQVFLLTAVNLRTIRTRRGSTASAVIGIALVVAVLLLVLSIAEGFLATMTGAGSPETAIVLRSGSDSEMSSVMNHEMADIVAYLYTSHYFDPAAGSSARGQQVVQTRGCIACHSVRGKGGKVAADFATSNVVGSPAALVAAMWNHSRSMEDQATKQGLKLPTLKGQELADIAAYFRSFAKAASMPQK